MTACKIITCLKGSFILGLNWHEQKWQRVIFFETSAIPQTFVLNCTKLAEILRSKIPLIWINCQQVVIVTDFRVSLNKDSGYKFWDNLQLPSGLPYSSLDFNVNLCWSRAIKISRMFTTNYWIIYSVLQPTFRFFLEDRKSCITSAKNSGLHHINLCWDLAIIRRILHFNRRF